MAKSIEIIESYLHNLETRVTVIESKIHNLNSNDVIVNLIKRISILENELSHRSDLE
jgi:hypothetical protein